MLKHARFLPIAVLLAQSAITAQDPKSIYDAIMEGRPRPDITRDTPAEEREQKIEAYRKELEEFKATVAKRIEEHRVALSSGEGLFYLAQAQSFTGDHDAAEKSLSKFIETAPDSENFVEGVLMAATMAAHDDPDRAEQLLAKVEGADLSQQQSRRLDGMKRSIEGGRARNALNGKPAPAIPALHVVNGGEASEFSLGDYEGKVVLVDFWATWCPPCREVIPHLVELQKKYGDDVQVLGVTRFYGHGSDFSGPDVELPHGGKSVKDLEQEQEITVNEVFAKAFDLNYPIVFTETKIAGEEYGVQGIPTLFVIGRDGRILGHTVGSGSEAQLDELVAKAVGAGAAPKAGGSK